MREQHDTEERTLADLMTPTASSTARDSGASGSAADAADAADAAVPTSDEASLAAGGGAASAPSYEPIHTGLLWSMAQRGLALFGLLCVLPLFPVVALAVKFSSPGPLFFVQKRRGLGGRVLNIYKIRTLPVGTDKKKALGVSKTDSDMTFVGRLLRTLKIDELPQLWNVVRGDLDLVGPRPIPIKLEDELREHIPGFRERNRVKPGVTSLSQITVVDNGVGDQLIRDWSVRFRGELHYIRHKSFFYDGVIIVMSALYLGRTFLRVVGVGKPKPAAVDGREQVRPPLVATDVLGVPITNVDYAAAVNRVGLWIKEGRSEYVGVCPVHNIVEAVLHREHRDVLRGAGMNTADGMPVVWAQMLLGHREATRVYGPTLMLRLLEKAERMGWKVALYGGREDRLDLLVDRIRLKYPKLELVCAISPPYRALTDEEDAEMVARLNDAEADIVFVGLGCPKQERWMAEHKGRVQAVMLGVGAAFDFHAGAVRQAPPSLQRLGLEWAFRLWCEPRRLFKRYATTNPLYVALFGWQFVKRHVFRRKYQRVVDDGLAELPTPQSAAAAAAPDASSPARTAQDGAATTTAEVGGRDGVES